MEEEIAAGSLNKCGHLRSSDFDRELFFLADHGGEGRKRAAQLLDPKDGRDSRYSCS
jgi:hypothetical protein